LLNKLDGGRKGKATLITAPAGFGKTTLVSAWLQQSDTASGWLSLDAADNDLPRFLLYLAVALQTAEPAVGQEAVAYLQMPQAPPVEVVLTSLINDVVAKARAIILVLDDYHAIEAPAVHTALTFLLEHLPPQLHLVLTSRANPPLPLARLRGRGELSELRAADIRFTVAEATAFFQQFAHLALAHADLAVLTERTEGWIVGLQLAALSLENRADVAGFIQTFSGSNRFILDYLIEEVLEQRPAEVQTFLLYTSILDRMCGPLCAAVMGYPTGEQARTTLQHLEQANLFIISLDDERYWYRYHHLFADMLRQRLREAAPDRIPELHRRASIWLEAQGLLAEAVEQARRAGDMARVARLVEQETRSLIMRGFFDTARRWLTLLPATLIGARPRLAIAQAWARLFEIPMGDVESALQQAEASLAQTAEQDSAETSDLRAEITAMRAIMVGLRGQRAQTIELVQTALRLAKPSNRVVHSTVTYTLASLYRASGDWETAQQAFQTAIAAAQAGDNVIFAAGSFYNFAMLHAKHGDLNAADSLLQQAETFARSQPNLWPWPIVDSARVGMGRLCYERNELDQAQHFLQQGIDLATQRGNLYLIIDGKLALAWLHQTRGEVALAQTALHQATALATHATRPDTVPVIMANQARLWLLQGNIEPATQWAQQQANALAVEPEDADGLQTLTLARVLIAQGAETSAQALVLLEHQAEAVHAWPSRRIQNLLLQGLAHNQLGRQMVARALFQQALMLGEAGGYVRLFADEGPMLAALLAQLPPTPYRDKVLAAFASKNPAEPAVTHAQNSPPAHQPLVEPLSERELEVVRLMVAGISNKEIADQLVITVGTVKNHMSNILGKLGARNRWEAARRVEELGLL